MSDVDVDDALVQVAYEAYRESIRDVLAGTSHDAVRGWDDLPSNVRHAWRRSIETAICRWEHVA